MLYRDEGVVLRTYKLGEADRIVVLCTRHHGKVRAVAKGVRKTKSKFGSRLEPISHVALQLYEGRELDIVTQVESIDHFRAIRDDLDRIARASTMLEAVDQMSQEGGVNPRLYQMTIGGLRGARRPQRSVGGAGVLLEAAGARGVSADARRLRRVRVSRTAGGLRPRGRRRAVRRRTAGAPPSHPRRSSCCDGSSAVSSAAALNEPESPATVEVDHLATRAIEHHLERRLRSATVLDRA